MHSSMMKVLKNAIHSNVITLNELQELETEIQQAIQTKQEARGLQLLDSASVSCAGNAQFLRKVVEEMVEKGEVNVVSRYESLSKNNVMGDFRFIVMEKFLSRDNSLPMWERMMMRGYFILKKFSLSEERGFGLDPSDVTLEKYPIYVSAIPDYNLKRIKD